MSHFIAGPHGWVEVDYRFEDGTLPLRYGRWRHPDPQHWHHIRKLALDRDGWRCRTCNRDDLQLNAHHRTYERWGEEDVEDVTILCRQCHEVYHGIGERRAA